MLRATRGVVGAGLLAVGLVLTGGPGRADDSKLKVKVGDPFPDTAVPAVHADLVKKGAKELSIKDVKGKIAVVAFYPKALTGG
jgi:peroxiredoxin Q/BCP